jgi:hypothetical protein
VEKSYGIQETPQKTVYLLGRCFRFGNILDGRVYRPSVSWMNRKGTGIENVSHVICDMMRGISLSAFGVLGVFLVVAGLIFVSGWNGLYSQA